MIRNKNKKIILIFDETFKPKMNMWMCVQLDGTADRSEPRNDLWPFCK